MKNGRIPVMVLITCVFAAFLAGFFAGRNLNRTPVMIRTVSPAVTEGAETEAEETEEPASTVPAIINVNTATAEELETLPGIGPVLAQRIIAYREEYGPFQSVGELAFVSGIGEKKLEAIWDLVTTGG